MIWKALAFGYVAVWGALALGKVGQMPSMVAPYEYGDAWLIFVAFANAALLGYFAGRE